MKQHGAEMSLPTDSEMMDTCCTAMLQSPVSTWLIDSDGNLVAENEAARQLFGIERDEEVVGKYNIFRDEELIRQGFIPQIRRVFDMGGAAHFVVDYDFSKVTHVSPAHPTHRIIRVFIFALRDKNGRLRKVVMQHEDYTEKTRMEKALTESESRYRELVEEISDWVWEIDLESRYTYSNPVIKQVLGYTADEIVGKKAFDLITPEDRGRMSEEIARAVEAKSSFQGLVHKMVCKDGSLRIIESSGRPILDSDGNVTGFRGVGRDVTERVRAEEALRVSEERLSRLVETVPGGIVILGTDGKIEFANSAAERILGLPHDQIVGRAYNDPQWRIAAVDGGPFPEEELAFARVIKTGRPVHNVQYAMQRPDGRVVVLSVNAAPLRDHAGQIVGVVASLTDITAEKQVQSELKHRTEFESVVINLATNFINLPSQQVDEGIDRALGEVGRFLRVDRSFIFLITEDGRAVTNTHEWVAEGGTSAIYRFRRLEIADYPLLVKGLAGQEAVHIPDVDALPDACRKEKEVLQSVEAKSLIALPMISRGKTIGFLGFVTTREKRMWSEESVTLLRVLGEVLANALTRKWADEELRAQRDRAQLYLDTARVMMVVITRDGKVELINRRGAEVLGYPESEIIGKDWIDNFVPERIRSSLSEVFGKLMAGEIRPVEYNENPILTSRGEERLIAWHNAVLRDDQGRVYAIVSSGEDITERRKAEEAVRRSEARFRAIFDYAPALILLYDARGILHQVNDTLLQFTGFAREELIGHSVFDTFAQSEIGPTLDEITRRVFGGETVSNVEWRIERKDGQIAYALANATPLYGDQGQVEYVLAMGVDITERKIAEQKARELEEHKREFYRRTIRAATNGKLIITERDEIQQIAGPAVVRCDIRGGEDLSTLRREVREFAESAGLDSDRTYDLVLAVGEAATNAIKHAGGGTATLHTVNESVMVVISDQGPGIEALTLPDVALMAGYSTAGTLGMGYKAMLSIADTVYLATGPGGTTVAIQMLLHPSEKPSLTPTLPDAWVS